MFGTLIVQLPSVYDGGQLVVKHLTEKKEFDFSGSDNSSDFHYAAFYADCIHEIKPVTQGYRLCLVYNLIYKGLGVCPAPVDHQQQVKEIVLAMNDWNNDNLNNCPLMMAYVLEHQYPKSSTSFRLLKRADKAMADVLMEASRKGHFDLSLTTVEASQIWTADDDDYYCSGPHELIEEDITFGDLIMPGDHKINCCNLFNTCNKELFVPDDFLEDADPDDEEYESYTGNEGATLSKQYSMAVLLIWPPRSRCKLLNRLGLDFPHINQEEGNVSPLVEVVNGLASCRKLSLSAVHFLLALLHNDGNRELFELALTNSFSRMAHWSISVGRCLSFVMFLRDTACIKNDLLERTVRNIVAGLSKSTTEDATDSMSLLRFVFNLDKPDIVSMILEAFTSRANSSIDYYHSFLKLIHNEDNMREIFEIVADNAIDVLFNKHNRQDYFYIGAQMPISILLFFKQIGREDLLERVTQNVATLQRSCVPYDVWEFREFLTLLSGLNKPKLILQAILALFEGLSKPLQTGVRSKYLGNTMFIEELVTIGNMFGWSSLQTSLDVLFSCDSDNSVETCGNFLCSLVGKILSEAEHKAMCKKLACTYMEALSREDDVDQSGTGRPPAFLVRLIRCIVLLTEPLSILVASLIKRPNIYPVQETLAPALIQLKRCTDVTVINSDALQRLVLHCVSFMEVSMKTKFVKPPSLSSPSATIKCSCAECKRIITFLKTQGKQQHRFRTVGGHPGHLQEQIAALCLDHTVTYSYICVTKSQAKYLLQRSTAQATLHSLKELLRTTAGASDQRGDSSTSLEPVLKKKKLNQVCIDLTND